MIETTVAQLTTTWKSVYEDKAFMRKFNITLGVCMVVYLTAANFLVMNKGRSGMLLSDPIQPFIQPRDLSHFIFFFTYLAVAAFLFHIIAQPQIMQKAFIGFTAIFIVRTLMIFVLPLAPPEGIVPLHDPVVDMFVMGRASDLRNDLFFSGHISDLSFFIFCTTNKNVRNFLIFSAVIVGIMLVAQRVHYTADVLAAPFFAYWGYKVFVEDKESSFAI